MTCEFIVGDASRVLVDMYGRRSFDMVFADPPWSYGQGGRGAAKAQYRQLSCAEIALHLDKSGRLVERGYMACWCTGPTLFEFFTAVGDGGFPWRYLGLGSWDKQRLGTGHHWRSKCEPVTLWERGGMTPRRRDIGNSWSSPRGEHSEKPADAIADLLRLGTAPGDTVLDVYAGETASLARVCHRLGRNYVGIEIDPKRAARAQSILEAVQ